MEQHLWKQAEEIFLACADLPDAERSQVLDQYCGDNDALRAIVMSLLEGDAQEDKVRSVVGVAADELSSSQVDRWINTTLGAYTIEKRLAEGGMGIVFLARRSDEQFEHKVAIKLLPARLATEEMRRRLRSERQILAKLKHPNIGMLLDGGETEDGVPYLVMEYVEGLQIDEYCQQHHLSLEELLDLFRDVCTAVQYAHTNLIIHRDIKPSNILVTSDGVPKLLDFGIAKFIDTSAVIGDAVVTMVGSRVFTPRHASPEQVRGESITTASDVYALGLLLYELLCGSFPYAIKSTSTAGELEQIITNRTPPPPSSYVDKTYARRLRGDLDTIVLKCLRKQPDARYQFPVEIANDLQRFLENRPISATPPTLTYLLARYWRRNRVAATGMAATATAIIVGAVVSTVWYIQAREAETQALAQARNAESISGFLVGLFEESNPNISAGEERSVRQVLESGRERVDTELANSPVVQAQVLATLSGVYKGLADYEEAEALQQRALILAEDHAADDLTLLAELRNDLGDLYRLRSKFAEATSIIGSALDAYSASGDAISEEWSDAVSNLGLVLDEMGEHAEGGARLEEALAMRNQLFDAPHAKIALSLHNLAWHYSRDADLEFAERYAVDAVAMRKAVFGEVHPRVASTVSLLSRIYRSRNKWDEAEREARISVAIAEQIFDTGHPDATFPMYELASVLHAKGELDEARELFSKIVAWERVSLGGESHDVGMSIKAYANVLKDLGEYVEAEALLRESLAIFEALPGGSRRGLHATQIGIADILRRTGRYDEAAEKLGVDRELGGASFDSPYAQRLRYIELTRLHLARGDVAEARRSLDKFYVLAETPGSGATSDSPELLALQAEIQLAEGHANLAIPLLERALGALVGRWGADHWQVGTIRAALGRALLDSGEHDAGLAELTAALDLLQRELGDDHPSTIEVTTILRATSRADLSYSSL